MPSLVGRRDKNTLDYDRGGRMNGMATNGGFDQYRDDFSREDMRRDDDDRYRRAIRNGGPSFDRFNTDYLDQNSLSDFRSNEPKFELDHLATFAAGARNGVIHAEDGLRKLRQMENTTGIWTMRCILIVERNNLIILDNSTGEELERFPIQLVQDPTAIFKNDRREIYNNLILFTIIDDPKKRSSHADMHIFQSIKAPAQEIVDEILGARNGQQRLHQGDRDQNSTPGPAPEPSSKAYNFQGMREFIDSRQYQINNSVPDMRHFSQTSYSQGGQFGGPINPQRSLITRVNTMAERENIEGGSTEVLERDVQLLNHCFDDIEKFVARLQQAAESYKELEKRKRDRGAKNKKRQSGDGMLNARARPPPDRDFVDIFQKFKLSFNLLAKLKAHIHDPNAPELVHFLFTPLSLIYEASRDPYHGNQNLGDQAVAPLLTVDAKQLLLNCLTSKEIELWQALGKNWTTSRNEWQGPIPPYVPEFYDGWQPAAGIEELATRSVGMTQPAIMAVPLPMIEAARPQPVIDDRQRGYNPVQRPVPFPDDDRPMMDRYHRQDEFERFEPPNKGYRPNSREFEPRGFEPVHEPSTSRGFESFAPQNFEPSRFKAHSPEQSSPRSGLGSPFTSDFETHQTERTGRQDGLKNIDRDPFPSAGMPRQDENNAYLNELKRMDDAIIYEAAHDRVGKNTKELTIQRGDILQVLDNSKNWWKLRNYKGEVGFAPYTILKAIKAEEEHFNRMEQMNGRFPNGASPLRTVASESSFFGDNRGPTHRGSSLAEASHNIQQRNRRRSRSISPINGSPIVSRREESGNVSFVARHRSLTPERRVSSHLQIGDAIVASHKRHSPTPQRRDSPTIERHRSPSPERRGSIIPPRRGSILPSNRLFAPIPEKVPSPSREPQRRNSPQGYNHPQRRSSPIPKRGDSILRSERHSPPTARRTVSPIHRKRNSSTSPRRGSHKQGRDASYSPAYENSSPRPQRRGSVLPPKKYETPTTNNNLPTRRRSSHSPGYENSSHEPERRGSVLPSKKYETPTTNNNLPTRRRTSPSFKSDPKPNIRARSPPKHVPPPPVLPPRPSNKPGYTRHNVRQKNQEIGNNVKAKLHEELKERVRQPRSSKTPIERRIKKTRDNKRIDQYSSEDAVLSWLISKGFSNLAQETYGDFTGEDMFKLHLPDIEEVLGHEEAVRLDGLLTLQKSSSGYATRSAKELNDILRKRKQDCEPEIEVLSDQQSQEEESSEEDEKDRRGVAKRHT